MEKTIKVGYDSQTGFYTFKTIYYSTMKVNGKPVSDPLFGFKAGELIVTSEKPTSITYSTNQRKLVGYRNSETNEKVSVEDYKVIDDKIALTREYDEDSEEFIYSNIEDEVFALRFYRTHTAVYENVEEFINLEIELIEYPVSAYKCIIPLYSLDANNVFETKCKFVPNNTEVFFEVCASYGIDKSRINIPNHSGLRYAKIDDKYLYGMEDFEKTANATTIGTYEECVARMNTNRKKLEDAVSFQIASQSKKVLDKTTVGHLLAELKILQNSVYGLDVKQKEYTSKRVVSNRINELIDVYKRLA